MHEADKHELASYIDSLPDSSNRNCDIYRQFLELNVDATGLFSGKRGIEVWKREDGVGESTSHRIKDSTWCIQCLIVSQQ